MGGQLARAQRECPGGVAEPLAVSLTQTWPDQVRFECGTAVVTKA
jgi:hypothetical protein